MSPSVPSSRPSTSTVLDDLRALHERVVERIHELEPFEQELAELRQTAERLGIDVSAPKPARKAAARTKAGGTRQRRARSGGRPRRRARQGSRAEQVIALVTDRPGITVPQLGEALGIDSTGLYRVVRQLEGEGRLRKDGRELHPVAGSGTDDEAVDTAAS